MRRMVEAAAGIKTDVSVLLTDAVKRGQECFCRGGIRYLLCMPVCEDDRIPVLTVFLNRVRVLQAREEPALKLTSFKSAVPTLAHTAAVAAVEAFIGFRDLLDFLACKKTSSPIGAIQNSPVPLRDLAPVPVEFIGVVGTVADERNIFVPNRNKCFIVVDFAAL